MRENELPGDDHQTRDADGPALNPRAEDQPHRPAEGGAAEAASTVDQAATGDYIPGPPPPPEAPGSRIGPYQLLQKLGEGGMGAVFLAEQREPVQRRVALKIIKAGMDSAHVIARFEAERQALALMDHPNIARVLDAGATADGLPYFVMELVQGIPFTRFCAQQRLTLRELLELFIPVCQAVQHAHQKGIIHRDLKPSNVLVAQYDGKAVPKVIDFGVAKATAQKLTERTMFTEVGQLVGTLEYMAPEQAELGNLDIDTRADIYALGVLLYELLTGGTPFPGKQLRAAGFTEMLRTIREVEPPRPSARLAAERGSGPEKLVKQVRGDLDWIVMKCLEKDRTRRYETANGLASDVRRYLADEPVLAGPPSVRYRLEKFVRRHRGPVLAATISVLLLIAGIIGTSVGLLRAERSRELAEEKEQAALAEKAKALAAADAERRAKQKAEAAQKQAMEALQATTDDVVEHLIGSRSVLGPVERTFLENVQRRWQTFAAAQGDSELARHACAEGASRVAALRHRFGDRPAALAGYREAKALWEKLAADFPAVPLYRRELARSHDNLGLLLHERGDRAKAEAACRVALTLQEKLAADFPAEPRYRWELANSYRHLGIVLSGLSKHAGAAAYRKALALQEKLAADFPTKPAYRQELARSHSNLGFLLHERGQDPEAEAAYRKALAIQEKLAADFPTMPTYRQDLAHSYSSLGALLRGLSGRAEAEKAYRQALAIDAKLAADFPALPTYRQQLATTHNNLGNLLSDSGEPEQAAAAHRKALAIQEKLTADFPAVPVHRQHLATTYNNLGNLLSDLGKRAEAEAEAAYGQALALQEKLAADLPAVPAYRWELARTHSNLGLALRKWGKGAKAEAAYRKALSIQEKLAADFPAVPHYRIALGSSQGTFGNLLLVNKHPEQALPWYAKAIANLESALGQVKDDPTARLFLRNAHWSRAQALDALKRHAEAVADWDKVVALSSKAERPLFRMSRAVSRVRVGQVDAALKEADALAKSMKVIMLYNAACVFALAADRREEGAGMPSKEQCAKRAIALLYQAIARGFRDAAHLKREDDLKALRGRADFQKLLAELEMKSP